VNRVACVASSLRVRTESGRSTWRRRPEEQEVDDRQDATEEQAPEEARGPATEIHHSREGGEKKERKKERRTGRSHDPAGLWSYPLCAPELLFGSREWIRL